MGCKRYSLGSPPKAGIGPSAVCIGEKISSLRQYWKIPTPLSPAATETGLVAVTPNTYTYMVYNNDVSNQITSISTAPSPSSYKGDVIGLIQSCYVFVVGSFRVFSTLSAANNMMGVTYAAGATTFSGVSVNKDATAFMKVYSASNEPVS